MDEDFVHSWEDDFGISKTSIADTRLQVTLHKLAFEDLLLLYSKWV